MTLMLDNVFGIFNNVPPRINWAELELPFPSDDRYFQIANYEELTATRLFPPRKMKIEEAFLILFLPPEAAKEKLKVLRDGSLTALDMQLLIHCMSCASFNMLVCMLTYNSPHSPLHPPLDAYFWQPPHLAPNNQHARPPPPVRNGAVELEDDLERDQILVSARGMGETGVPEVGTVVLRYCRSAAECLGANGRAD